MGKETPCGSAVKYLNTGSVSVNRNGGKKSTKRDIGSSSHKNEEKKKEENKKMTSKC